ncbi:MAG: hypothetical protein QME74_01535 [Candidatus Edwardsbacteria bacterium]|nr:hypothetical protein [Candidatus Edwardsbacteria bacterium]
MNDAEKTTILKPDDVTAVELIERAQIDTQIQTAHRFPRSMEMFKQRAIGMATLDSETAESCVYARPVGRGKDGKPIYAEGLSIRMAEIVGASYGNLRVGSILIEQTDRQVKARGFAHDLESNFAASCEVVESTIDRDGRPYSERMRTVVAKACLAKARRDATFQVVPKALCKPIELEARKVAVGDAITLEKRRAFVMQWITRIGVASERVFACLGIRGESDIGIEQLARLTGIKTAIQDGDVTLEEAFPAGEIAMPRAKSQSAQQAAQAPESPAAPTEQSKKTVDGAKKPAKVSAARAGQIKEIRKLMAALPPESQEAAFAEVMIDIAAELSFLGDGQLADLKASLQNEFARM